MHVKIDLDSLTCDLVDLDVAELSLLHDALSVYMEALDPESVEGLPTEAKADLERILSVVERIQDKLARPLEVLEDEADRHEEMEGDRVRIVLEGSDEASSIHEAATELSSRVAALDPQAIPYPDAKDLLREFAAWFDPDDIPEYPYYIEMDVADARVIAAILAEVQARGSSEQLDRLMKVMTAASTVDEDDEDEDETP